MARRARPTPHRRPQFGTRYQPPGTAPGTLTPLSQPRSAQVRVTVLDYSPEHVTEKEVGRIEEVFPFRDTASVTWINVEGLADVELLASLGRHFKLHPLALEDVLNCGQRPKVEDYDDYEFAVLKSLHRGDAELEVEQISLVFGRNYVITFQERPGDSFAPVRERIRKGKGQIRRAGPDYLAYALMDALIDEFFPVLERYGERIEELEDELVDRSSPQSVHQIHALKRDLLVLRRAAWPERDLVNALLRAESPLIHPETKVFLRDCYDHMVQAMDMIETYRELAAGMLDVYLSSVSNRMNEIMKVLTIIATIFIPLSFVAGIYGMNFDPASPWNLPELHWRFGYLYSLGLMAAVALGMLLYFKRKGWL
ncbi:MAG TPA: magnesium/cobalt transporter CorA [Thermoanaerobaculia bacterium]|nr:magnesium/cobalt transporter CorA [Thermoanaerobaculia bacterium]